MRFAKANRRKPGLGQSKLVRSAPSPATVAAGVIRRATGAQRPSSACRLFRQPYHCAATLAAIWSAIFNAESAGLALQVLMSIMTLFLCASARPQPQPGALAFC